MRRYENHVIMRGKRVKHQNNKCKGPEAEEALTCSEKRKEARWLRVKKVKETLKQRLLQETKKDTT